MEPPVSLLTILCQLGCSIASIYLLVVIRCILVTCRWRVAYILTAIVVDLSKELHAADGKEEEEEHEHGRHAGQERQRLHEAHHHGTQAVEACDGAERPEGADGAEGSEAAGSAP
eukprot:scaffold47641_cov35-Prasinocladus_malaysianus.AAC.1